jgi:predicted permease
MNDFRYAVRGFARNPGFVAAAVLSLGIGIGANTAIFSVADALLLGPLPYPDADRLAILWNRSPGLNIAQDWFSTAQYCDIRDGHHGFEAVAAALGGYANLTGSGEPERVGIVRLSSGALPMLGARTAAGRLFEAREDAALPAATAILSYGMWTRRFGADPMVLGKSVTLDGRPYTIVGVTARTFALPHEVLPTLGSPQDPDILLPLPLAPSAAQARNREDYNVIGRLKRGVTLSEAQAEMDTITARLRRDHPDLYPPNGGLTFGIVPLREQVVGDSRRTVWILLGAVAFVLAIACANVANLMLSRALARGREMAVRAALGAGHARLVRQMLTESLLLSTAGGALGALFAAWSVAWIRMMGPKSVPRVEAIAIDGRVLAFTAAVSVLCGVLFGLAPALRAARSDLHTGMKKAARADRLRRLLVVSELALSVVLLIGAGLLVRSFARLLDVRAGFDPKGVLTLGLTMTGPKYGNPQTVRQTYRELWQRLERLPGVTAAGGVSVLPMSDLWAWGPIVVEGRTPPAGEMFLNADQRIAAGNYFQAMRIPLRRGRYFNEQDTPDKPRVAIVDEYMAEQLWPGQDGVGKRFKPGGVDAAERWTTVVGVVGRVKQYTLDADSRIALYFAHTQSPRREMSVAVRGTGASAVAVRREIAAVDADLPVYQVRTMERQVEDSLARRRFSLTVLGVFAGLALGLAAIGIYGVMAFLVEQGTNEIGIRMALGATSGGILGMVLRRAMAMAAAGIGLGLLAAIPLVGLLRTLLFGVSPADALTFVGATALLTLVAMAASYLPARRASRIDPMISLRAE